MLEDVANAVKDHMPSTRGDAESRGAEWLTAPTAPL